MLCLQNILVSKMLFKLNIAELFSVYSMWLSIVLVDEDRVFHMLEQAVFRNSFSIEFFETCV
jgi:hypothetical protein